MGFSLGGLNAAFSALRKPALFGNVLSQSGAFWWRPPGEAESDWLAKQFAAEPKFNVKFYMDVGLLEAGSSGGAPLNWLTRFDQPIPYGPSMLLANRHMRDILRLKGYQVVDIRELSTVCEARSAPVRGDAVLAGEQQRRNQSFGCPRLPIV